MSKRAKREPVEDVAPLGRPGGPGADADPFGVLLIKSNEGRAFVLPRSVGRLRGQAEEVVAALQEQAMARDDVERRIDHLVEHARELGVAWSVVGWSVGLTGEGARRRWTLDD